MAAMSRFTLRSLLLAVMLIGVCLGSCLAVLPKTAPSAATMQVKAGMTRAEVQALLGAPNERVGVMGAERTVWYYYLDPLAFSMCGVAFDSQGRVTGFSY